jgi:pilus assembly protein FimV
MVSKLKSGAALALLVSAAISAQAAGLGKLTINSALGQPLNAEIDLVSLQPGEADNLSARVASPEAFRDARIEFSSALRLLRFSVEKRPSGQQYIKITSIGPINEPFVDALIEVSWPSGRMQREYPILLDPPGYGQGKVTAPTVSATPAAAPTAPVTAPTTSDSSAAASTTASPDATAAPTPPTTESSSSSSSSTGSSTPPAPAPSATADSGSPSARAELGGSAPRATAGDTYGPVEKGENLAKIANQVKPADVSLEQMLVALYRENQGAFSGKNMNRLKTGQILKVPSPEEVAAITAPDANREVRTHVTEWKSYREQLATGAASLPAPTDSASNAATGRVSSAAVTPPAPPSSESSDRLRLSKSDSNAKAGASSGGGGGGGASQERLNQLQEEVIAKDKALRESQSRVADLEKQIRDMQRLLDLKSNAAPAKTETKPDTKVATATPTPAPVPTPEPVKPAPTPEPAKATTPPTPEPAKPTPEPTKPADTASTTTTTTTSTTTTPAEPPKTDVADSGKAAAKPAPKKAAPPPQKSFMDELMDNPAYLAAGGGILLALIGGMLFVRRRRNRADLDENSQMTSAFPSDLKTGDNTSKPAGGLVDTGNSSFLTDFDKTGPGTIDTDEVDPVAEAEVYMAYGRDAQAEEILKEAMARDRNRHEIALKLLEIYHARKSATAFETVAKELHNAVGDNHPLWQKAAAMGAQIDPSNPLYVAAAGGTATYQPLQESAAAPAKPNLDFDLDSSSSAAPTSAAPSFDLDLDAQKPVASSAPAAASSGLDFDLAPSEAPKVDVPAETHKEEKPAFDFDLSGLDFPGSKSSSEAKAAAPAPSSGSMDLADLSLDTPAQGGGGEAVGTKLELAKAYLEIGDKDGAREILQEVANEGSSAQREEAKKLISSL